MIRTKSHSKFNTVSRKFSTEAEQVDQQCQQCYFGEQVNLEEALEMIKEFDNHKKDTEEELHNNSAIQQDYLLLTPKSKISSSKQNSSIHTSDFKLQKSSLLSLEKSQNDKMEIRLVMPTALGLITFITLEQQNSDAYNQYLPWFQRDLSFILIIDYWKTIYPQRYGSFHTVNLHKSDTKADRKLSKVVLNSKTNTLSLYNLDNRLLKWFNCNQIQQKQIKGKVMTQLYQYILWVYDIIKQQYAKSYQKNTVLQQYNLTDKVQIKNQLKDIRVKLTLIRDRNMSLQTQNPQSSQINHKTESCCLKIKIFQWDQDEEARKEKVMIYRNIKQLEHRLSQLKQNTTAKLAKQILNIYSTYWHNNIGDL